MARYKIAWLPGDGVGNDVMEAARIVMRRYIWSLNDESGGIGWGAPEAMAVGIYHHDGLCDEYLHMLISYMLPDGPLEHQDGNFLELPANFSNHIVRCVSNSLHRERGKEKW